MSVYEKVCYNKCQIHIRINTLFKGDNYYNRPERTILTLTTQSLLPDESILFFKETLKTNYDKLKNDEVLALVTAHQEDWVTNKRLQVLLDKAGERNINCRINFMKQKKTLTLGVRKLALGVVTLTLGVKLLTQGG